MNCVPSALALALLASINFGCSSSGGEGGGSQPSTLSGCEGPLGKPMEPSGLPGCCPDHPGRAHCFATSKVPAKLQSMLAKCSDAEACIPDDFIRTGGVFTPKTCTAFGGEGRCLSACIGAVHDKASVLKQDVCGEDELCVPCINPLDKTTTGACEVSGKCVGS